MCDSIFLMDRNRQSGLWISSCSELHLLPQITHLRIRLCLCLEGWKGKRKCPKEKSWGCKTSCLCGLRVADGSGLCCAAGHTVRRALLTCDCRSSVLESEFSYKLL